MKTAPTDNTIALSPTVRVEKNQYTIRADKTIASRHPSIVHGEYGRNQRRKDEESQLQLPIPPSYEMRNRIRWSMPKRCGKIQMDPLPKFAKDSSDLSKLRLPVFISLRPEPCLDPRTLVPPQPDETNISHNTHIPAIPLKTKQTASEMSQLPLTLMLSSSSRWQIPLSILRSLPSSSALLTPSPPAPPLPPPPRPATSTAFPYIAG